MLYLLDFYFLLINIDQNSLKLVWKIVQKKLVKQRVTVMLLTFQILNHRLMFVKYSTSNRRRFMGQNSGWFNFS
jgi:hypothetical protein